MAKYKLYRGVDKLDGKDTAFVVDQLGNVYPKLWVGGEVEQIRLSIANLNDYAAYSKKFIENHCDNPTLIHEWETEE